MPKLWRALSIGVGILYLAYWAWVMTIGAHTPTYFELGDGNHKLSGILFFLGLWFLGMGGGLHGLLVWGNIKLRATIITYAVGFIFAALLFQLEGWDMATGFGSDAMFVSITMVLSTVSAAYWFLYGLQPKTFAILN